jgi:hypothetical protein
LVESWSFWPINPRESRPDPTSVDLPMRLRCWQSVDTDISTVARR